MKQTLEQAAEFLYPYEKVTLARGNICLSCWRVKREAFKAGAEWQKKQTSEYLMGYLDGRTDAENKLLKDYGIVIMPEGELRMKKREEKI